MARLLDAVWQLQRLTVRSAWEVFEFSVARPRLEIVISPIRISRRMGEVAVTARWVFALHFITFQIARAVDPRFFVACKEFILFSPVAFLASEAS